MASENIDAKTAQTNGNVAAHARGDCQRMPSLATLPGIATQCAKSVNTQHALHVGNRALKSGHQTPRFQTRCTSALRARSNQKNVQPVGRLIRRRLIKKRTETSMIAAAIANARSAPNVNKRALRYGHRTQRFQTKCTGALHA